MKTVKDYKDWLIRRIEEDIDVYNSNEAIRHMDKFPDDATLIFQDVPGGKIVAGISTEDEDNIFPTFEL